MRDFAEQKFRELGIPIEELNRYDEPHRFYHNWEHIEFMLKKAKSQNQFTEMLFLAIVFHDIIYNPKASDNEEQSAELLYKYVPNDLVKQAILDTKTHSPSNSLSKQLCDLDLSIIYSDYETFIDFENKIFKEYQWVDYLTYKDKRIEILSDLGANPDGIEYVKYRTPKIAVYAGSFNPFHKGHLNILEKAEQIFDKVIIARGVNPDKKNELIELPSELQFRQIETYNGLLTDFIDKLGYDVTLIRGLRNSNDLQYELTQYRYLQDLNKNIKVVSLFCDREFEHISSSAIRQLKQFDKGQEYLIGEAKNQYNQK